jgi:hypothetical protein
MALERVVFLQARLLKNSAFRVTFTFSEFRKRSTLVTRVVVAAYRLLDAQPREE